MPKFDLAQEPFAEAPDPTSASASPGGLPASTMTRGEVSVSLRDFARSYGARYGWPLLGGFLAEKERAGELAGNERQWEAELQDYARRDAR